ncbi:hypothetical protein FACS1894192_00730 [Bacilli bacterium]|nr:hypothetical protein FACS1894192_00730 [Bacilli bacterium]
MTGIFKQIAENGIFPAVVIVAAYYILIHGLGQQKWAKVAGIVIIAAIIVGMIFSPDTIKTIGSVIGQALVKLIQTIFGG